MSDSLHQPKPGSAAAISQAAAEKQAAERKAQAEQRAREKAEAEKEEHKTKRQFRHDWAVAIVSAIVGALISRPVWACIDALIALCSRISG